MNIGKVSGTGEYFGLVLSFQPKIPGFAPCHLVKMDMAKKILHMLSAYSAKLASQ